MSMNNIAISLLCLLIIPLSSQASDTLSEACADFRVVLDDPNTNAAANNTGPFDKGMLWKIETPSGKTNYLFGTMHSQNVEVSAITPLVRGALMQSQTLVMETVPNQAANDSFIKMMQFHEGQRLEQLLNQTLFETLTKQIKAYGVPEEQVAHIKPWAAFSLIGRPIPTKAPTLEGNLYQLAIQNKLAVYSLETMTEILSALDNLSMDDQITILTDTICNHEQIIKSTENLIELYLNSDLAGIVAYNKQPHYDEGVFTRYMQNILYDRNIRMLERIEGYFSTGDSFVAVGASHLANDRGLLNQLSIKGYTITSIY